LRCATWLFPAPAPLAQVEGCLGYLLRKRESDPYKDLPARLLYEASWGGRRQAPTFNP
jgi:hypothetical protein